MNIKEVIQPPAIQGQFKVNINGEAVKNLDKAAVGGIFKDATDNNRVSNFKMIH